MKLKEFSAKSWGGINIYMNIKSSIETWSQQIFSSRMMKSKLVTLDMPSRQAVTTDMVWWVQKGMLDLPIICVHSHWIRISTAIKVIFGRSEWFILNYFSPTFLLNLKISQNSKNSCSILISVNFSEQK